MKLNLDNIDVVIRKVFAALFGVLAGGSALLIVSHDLWLKFNQPARAVSPVGLLGDLSVPLICLLIWGVLSLNRMVGPAWTALVALVELCSKTFAHSPSMVIFVVLLVSSVVFLIIRDVTKAEIYGDIASLLGGALGSRAVEKAVDNLKPRAKSRKVRVGSHT